MVLVEIIKRFVIWGRCIMIIGYGGFLELEVCVVIGWMGFVGGFWSFGINIIGVGDELYIKDEGV